MPGDGNERADSINDQARRARRTGAVAAPRSGSSRRKRRADAAVDFDWPRWFLSHRAQLTQPLRFDLAACAFDRGAGALRDVHTFDGDSLAEFTGRHDSSTQRLAREHDSQPSAPPDRRFCQSASPIPTGALQPPSERSSNGSRSSADGAAKASDRLRSRPCGSRPYARADL